MHRIPLSLKSVSLKASREALRPSSAKNKTNSRALLFSTYQSSRSASEGSHSGQGGKPPAAPYTPPSQSHTQASSKTSTASYTHVSGSPNPDSHRSSYIAADSTQASGWQKRSSTSTDPPHPLTQKYIKTTEEATGGPDGGVGSSNRVSKMEDAVEFMDKGKKEGKTVNVEIEEGVGREETLQPDFREDLKDWRPPLDEKK